MTVNTLSLSEPLRDYFLQMALREPDILRQLREETSEHRVAKMSLAPEQGALLIFLLRLIGAKRYIEVGTFLGYSSIAAAIAMGEDSQVIACDVCEEFTIQAQSWWKRAGIEQQTKLYLDRAVETLPRLLEKGAAGQFDCMLIDADKPNYPNYYEYALQLVRPRGLIILDNMFLNGRVATPQASHPRSVAILHEFNRQLRDDQRVEHCILPAGDGMTILFKR
ncbi:class I SAM-dependent methyltransferase [Chitinibacter fontanus]|uniref:Class I SAM-dependent methyltransferase n=1 Tax=Chitinibacter fontanus TaxID=1737446 RepID=A0A7D5VAE4_9NEIS|nr:class I SAM-dependent methyltransferase [Chitinibacter fontanus]QLI81580.1 class I SAM-dependent methyltransferase [Chitinibacter fontanus]